MNQLSNGMLNFTLAIIKPVTQNLEFFSNPHGAICSQDNELIFWSYLAPHRLSNLSRRWPIWSRNVSDTAFLPGPLKKFNGTPAELFTDFNSLQWPPEVKILSQLELNKTCSYFLEHLMRMRMIHCHEIWPCSSHAKWPKSLCRISRPWIILMTVRRPKKEDFCFSSLVFDIILTYFGPWRELKLVNNSAGVPLNFFEWPRKKCCVTDISWPNWSPSWEVTKPMWG